MDSGCKPDHALGPCCITMLLRNNTHNKGRLVVELTDCLGQWEARLGHVISLALPAGSVYRLTVRS
jgi:hypothetical protein